MLGATGGRRPDNHPFEQTLILMYMTNPQEANQYGRTR